MIVFVWRDMTGKHNSPKHTSRNAKGRSHESEIEGRLRDPDFRANVNRAAIRHGEGPPFARGGKGEDSKNKPEDKELKEDST